VREQRKRHGEFSIKPIIAADAAVAARGSGGGSSGGHCDLPEVQHAQGGHIRQRWGHGAIELVDVQVQLLELPLMAWHEEVK